MPGPKPEDDSPLEYHGHHIILTERQSKDLPLLMNQIRQVAATAAYESTMPTPARAPWRSWLFDIQACIDYMWGQIDPEVRGPRSLSREVAAKDKEIAELTAQLERSRTAVGLLSEMQVPAHLEYKAREVELENAKAYIARLEGIQAELTEVDKAREAELKAHKERVTELEQEIETVEAEQAQAERKLNAAYHEMEIRAAENLAAVQRLRATRGKPPEPNKVVVAEPLDARIAKALGYNLGHIRTRSLEQVRATLKVNAHTSRTYIDLIAEVDELNSRNVPGPWWAAR